MQHRGPAGDVEHFERRSPGADFDTGLREALAEFVGTDGVQHVLFRQMPQHRLAAAARIEDAIDGFMLGHAEPIDDAQRPEH